MSAEPPAEFLEVLVPLLVALERDVGLPAPRVEVHGSGIRATLVGGTLLVPEGYVRHWRRFGVLPTALIRDAAYAMKRASMPAAPGTSPEADAMAYSERFLRLVTEPEED